MHSGPEDPCREARKLYKSQIGHCVCAPYDCKVALIPVPEWRGFRATSHPTPNDMSHVLALLDRRLGYSRHHHWGLRFDAQQISNWSDDMCDVANCKDFRMF